MVGRDSWQHVYTQLCCWFFVLTGVTVTGGRGWGGRPASRRQVGSVRPTVCISQAWSSPPSSQYHACSTEVQHALAGCCLCRALSSALGTWRWGRIAALLEETHLVAQTEVLINYTAVWRGFYQGCVWSVMGAWEGAGWRGGVRDGSHMSRASADAEEFIRYQRLRDEVNKGSTGINWIGRLPQRMGRGGWQKPGCAGPVCLPDWGDWTWLYRQVVAEKQENAKSRFVFCKGSLTVIGGGRKRSW